MAAYNILIVDDQREVRRVLRAGLEMLHKDIKVVDVPSGEEAILVISRQPINLLITDIRLPGISGLELKERAQIRNPNLKFILITGMSDEKVRQEVADAGADAYFFKPVEMSVFLDAVQDCLNLTKSTSVIAEAVPVVAPVSKEKSPPAPGNSVAERLAILRRELHALSVVLIDVTGKAIAQDGVLPEFDKNPVLASALISAAEAAVKISSILSSSKPTGVMQFSGMHYDLFLAPTGPSTGLLLAVDLSGSSDEQITGLQRSMRAAVQDLQPLLRSSETVPPLKPNVQAFVDMPSIKTEMETDIVGKPLPDLVALLERAQKKKYKTEEIDAYWAAAAVNENSEINSGDGLSYEQALKLGLAPEDQSRGSQ